MTKKEYLETLQPFNKMTKERHIEICRKGGINSGKKYRERKQKALTYTACVEIIKKFLTSPIDDKFKEKIAEACGDDQDTYLGALVAAPIIKAIERGDVLALSKILEIIREFETQTKPGNTKNFESLIEAIKYARKSEPEAKEISD